MLFYSHVYGDEADDDDDDDEQNLVAIFWLRAPILVVEGEN